MWWPKPGLVSHSGLPGMVLVIWVADTTQERFHSNKNKINMLLVTTVSPRGLVFDCGTSRPQHKNSHKPWIYSWPNVCWSQSFHLGVQDVFINQIAQARKHLLPESDLFFYISVIWIFRNCLFPLHRFTLFMGSSAFICTSGTLSSARGWAAEIHL